MTVDGLRVRSGSARVRRTIAVLVTVACVIASGAWVPAYAAPAKPVAPPRPSPGRSVSGVKAVPFHFATPRDAAKDNYRPAATHWPVAAMRSVSLASAVTARATGTPVWVRPKSAGPTVADVRVLDQSIAQRAGLPGVVFTVSPKGQGSGPAEVGLDYAGFAEAYGGNYGSRLRMVQLPDCAVTTPELRACRTRTPLKSTNDSATHAVSAEVSLAAAPVVLAAVTDPGTEGGKGGTYAASDLKPSGSWAGGGSSGSFTYSYPIAVPPAASDLAPAVALSYDSAAVDGQTASTQAQSSWVGDGWGTPQSFVEQSFASCKDDPGGSASPKKTADLCYNGPTLTLSLAGSSSTLVWDNAKNVWKPESDNGEVITRVTNFDNGSGTHDHDYWQVTARDGTVYMFGRNRLPGWATGKATTKSVDTVPVYSPHAGDPCFDSAGFASSVCTMARRWNLDYVADAHGNAIAYYYGQDTNFYGRNEGATMASYVRDSHLDHIDYGFTDGNAYGTAPDRIAFGAGDRCVSGTCRPLNAANKANWPDVPFDLICASGATCNAWSPSFFSTVRLASITTLQYDGSQYVPVDSYALTQTMPASGDGTSPTLWLSSVVHTGDDTTAGGSTSPITLPSVSFTSIRLPNRVVATDGLPVFNRHRVETVTTETGSVITASYELPSPCPRSGPATNTGSCYPVRWTPDGFTAPIVDWFNKYAVTRVTATDPTGGAPATFTSYAYLGGAAWHYDENETVKAKYRTYGEFRGYATVQTFTGDGNMDRRTVAATSYYRGMSRNNNAPVVNVTDSAGGVHEDLNDLAGATLETTAYKGEGGAVDHSTITAYWVSAPTATRHRDGLVDLTANWIAPALSYSRQAVTGGSTTTWRYTQTDSSYDANIASPTVGLLKATYTHTVPAVADFDRCMTNTYAKVDNTTKLVGLVAQTETVSVKCGGFTEGSPATEPASLNTLTAPASVSRPDQVVSNTRTFYDDVSWSTSFPQPAAPKIGNVTMVQQASGYAGGTYTYQTAGRSTYDSYGRVVDAYDGNGNKTSTAYTMNSVGLTVGVSVNAPLLNATTKTVSPRRGLALTTTDPNGVVTTQQFDALGRATKVWLNSRDVTTPANYVLSYAVSKTGITASTTARANESDGYLKSITLYDAQLRPRQTQTMTEQSGRMVTDTFYDTRGWVAATYNGWWDSATTPNTTLVTAADLHVKVPNQTFSTYDGLGRAVIQEQAKNGVTVSRTTTAYGGDRTTVIPPAGATTTTTVTDPLGRTSDLQQYTAVPTVTTPADLFTGTVTVTGGTKLTSHYGYDGHGKQNTLTDAAGNTWTSQYNLLGQVTGKVDPDAGATTDMTYDGDGNLTQSTDSRSKTVSTTYDALNRKTGSYAAATSGQSTANRLTSMIYDNANNAVPGMTFAMGKLTTATAYWNGQEYKTQAKGFNAFGESIGETVSIPAAEGALAGDYTFGHIYSRRNGLPFKDSYPNEGGLPDETVFHQYDAFDQLNNLYSTISGYADGVNQDAYGRITYALIGSAPNQATISNTYDEHTGRLTQQIVNRTATTPANVDQQDYQYDLAGNLTRQISARPGAGTAETQCFTYDQLRRVTDAWTATDNCAAAPTGSDHAMVGNTIGAGSAYWTSWAFDNLGSRTQQTEHGLTNGTADTTTSYSYDGNNAGQPHTLTSTNTAGATTGSTSYQYDSAGNMTARNAGNGNQTLSWNDAGKLVAVTSSAGTSTSLYGPDGNLLIQKDPGTTTLYLPNGQQHVLDTNTGAVTGTRYYAMPGGGTCIRTGAGRNFTFSLTDAHGTPTLYFDDTAQTPTWRQYTPYGAPRGAAATVPDNHGFLNKPVNAVTGLTHVGAREYDPATGRFVSLDPIQDTADPQQWNGYAYANNNPATFSDPTGLLNPIGNRGDTNRSSCNDACQNLANKQNGRGEGNGRNRSRINDVVHSETCHRGQNCVNSKGDRYLCGRGTCFWAETRGPKLTSASDPHFRCEDFGSFDCEKEGLWAAAIVLTLVLSAVVDVGALVTGPVGEGVALTGEGLAVRGETDAMLAAEGVEIGSARFAQKSFSETFSKGGLFGGRTIDDVAGDLSSGTLLPKDVPISVVVRDGNTLILNTRSAQALTRAGIPRDSWNVINRTGDPFFEGLLSGQLGRNGLTSGGFDFP
jgi:RHS repeat-associated protein